MLSCCLKGKEGNGVDRGKTTDEKGVELTDVWRQDSQTPSALNPLGGNNKCASNGTSNRRR